MAMFVVKSFHIPINHQVIDLSIVLQRAIAAEKRLVGQYTSQGADKPILRYLSFFDEHSFSNLIWPWTEHFFSFLFLIDLLLSLVKLMLMFLLKSVTAKNIL